MKHLKKVREAQARMNEAKKEGKALSEKRAKLDQMIAKNNSNYLKRKREFHQLAEKNNY